VGINVLERIRKRGRGVAHAMLPLLVLAWLNAAAGPCIGMAATFDGAESRSNSTPEHGAHADAEHGADAGFERGAHVEHDGGGHSVEHHGAGPSTAAEAMHGGSVPAHDHADCPHCPQGEPAERDGPSAAHVSCDTADAATADARYNAHAKWELKHSLAPTAQLTAVPAAPLRQAPHRSPIPPATGGGPSLSLRYCVFLL
jgi:hypothetical protein